MNKLALLFGLATGVASLIAIYRSKPSEQNVERTLEQHLEANGLRVTTTSLGNGDRVIRFRGGYDDVMRILNPGAFEEKPPVPEDLDIESLPSYYCGCPHCGKMSMFGENQWRYQELDRTRGPLDNTTTYLTKCMNCEGFMKSTIDHDF